MECENSGFGPLPGPDRAGQARDEREARGILPFLARIGAPPMESPHPGPPVFRRVLLKLSGESFCRPGEGGICLEEVSRIARQASRVAARGVELAIVVGGGNILRGAQLSRGSDVIKEATAHYMGMTATVIN